MSDKKIIMPLEQIMGDRFGKYSKYIIQDRALPDVRDGLKPVQRRILYAMYKEGNIHSKPYRKCAKTVGVVIGNYHPHGDISVYDAMVRLSQDWKMRIPLVDIQGNNGSIDNDPAAAMRYTEARLSKIAVELLRDIDKETVNMALNFDDTEYEPTVLPARFPNLLVNGATGISAGYATDIPPHNYQEVIDATIYRIKHPKSTLDDIMNIIKGPDFPTGAIVEGKEGIRDAFRCGKGKVVVRSKVEIVEKKNMNSLVISEIPYEVNKAELVRKIDDIRFSRGIDGIIEVRDESDRNGLSIVVDLKKEIPAQTILNYLYKNTDLQKNYNYNMVAINDKQPVQMGLIDILDAYILHQIEVLTRKSLFELEKAKTRKHIVDGLMKAISILDEVVATIRKSKDKTDAKNNLISAYEFTEKQAEAIVTLQLYRLTNTDIVALQKEYSELESYILYLNEILDNDHILRKEIIKDLKEVRSLYPSSRLTQIKEEIEDITIDKESMIISEDVYISVTVDGYVKKISLRSYKASDKSNFGKKEEDTLLNVFKANTLDKLLLFTNQGNYLYIPINELEEFKWRDLGKHISYLVKTNSEEKMIQAMVIRSFRKDLYITCATKHGQIKRTLLSEFELTRYSKEVKCMNLKDDDEVISCTLSNQNDAILLFSNDGYVSFYSSISINPQGLKASGVKGMDLKGNRYLIKMITCSPFTTKNLLLISENGNVKRLKVQEIPVTNRGVKGLMSFKQLKTQPQLLKSVALLDSNESIDILFSNQQIYTLHINQYNANNLDSRLVSNGLVDKSLSILYIEDNSIYYESDFEIISNEQELKNEKHKYEKISFADLQDL